MGGSATAYTSLQKVDYQYNIRGWLKSINDINGLVSTDLGTPSDLFAFKISYDTPTDTNKALFNGNISETYWRTLYDDQQRKYTYTYDHLNRLLNADYSRPDNPNIKNAYKEELTYDKNGNILTLGRNGVYEAEDYDVEIDKLVYAYDPNNKNQLAKVTDNSGMNDGFAESMDTDSSNDDYAYDANGNMTRDDNKGILEIKYNHLNLPTKIVFKNSNNKNTSIEYLYDATGKKVTKKLNYYETIYTPGGGGEEMRGAATTSSLTGGVSYLQSLTVTDYMDGGYQYKGEVLEFIPHAEGFVKNDKDYKYYFNYTDHLGNVRVTYTDDGSGTPYIVEESNYYPFGLQHKGYNEPEQFETNWGNTFTFASSLNYKYKYNGKELQDELGLNMYDYGFRNYDAAIGRWMNIDPKAELSRRFSPYTYAMNNPVFFIDPDGMIVTPGSQREWDRNKQSVTSERDRLQGEVDRLNASAAENGWSPERLARRIGNMSDRISGLNETLGTLGTLEQSSQSYSLNKIGAGETGGVTYDSASDDVVISFGNTANFVHEITHAGQYESGDIAFDSSSGQIMAQDTGDEIAGYKAQYAYDPASVSGLPSSTSVNSSSDITVNWLQNVSDSSGNKIYAPGGSSNTGVAPLNTNSTKADILRAYPNNPALQSLPNNFTYKSISTLKYKR